MRSSSYGLLAPPACAPHFLTSRIVNTYVYNLYCHSSKPCPASARPSRSFTCNSCGFWARASTVSSQSTAPKQTDTTQRWKIRLSVEGSSQEIPTKIEFSRRGLDPDVALESVDRELLRRYRLPPILVQRYLPEAAFRQKIGALVSRKQTQARDVFDLSLLMDAGAGKEPLPQPLVKFLPQAVENAMGVGYDEFAGQVLAYLEPDYQDHYRERQVWEQIQERVTQTLDALQP